MTFRCTYAGLTGISCCCKYMHCTDCVDFVNPVNHILMAQELNSLCISKYQCYILLTYTEN